MSLLDKLVEKKDLDVYLRLRIRRLRQEITERLHKYPEKDRAALVKHFNSKIKELSKLHGALTNNKIKTDCKKMWKHFNYITAMEKKLADAKRRLKK